jgi:hypothetical protein
VAFEGLLEGNFTRAGYFEPLFCTGIGLDLWHDLFVFNNYTLMASRTGGLFGGRLGNGCYGATGSLPNRNSKWSAKVAFLPKRTKKMLFSGQIILLTQIPPLPDGVNAFRRAGRVHSPSGKFRPSRAKTQWLKYLLAHNILAIRSPI